LADFAATDARRLRPLAFAQSASMQSVFTPHEFKCFSFAMSCFAGRRGQRRAETKELQHSVWLQRLQSKFFLFWGWIFVNRI
jgi:hypothetical protein